jgi:hypothetical protein
MKLMLATNKGSEKENVIDVKIPNRDRRESKAPVGITIKDKNLPIFSDALKTSKVSTPVVSLKSSNSRLPKAGASTTIFLFFRFNTHSQPRCKRK